MDSKRWIARRKAEVVVRLIKGKLSIVDLCREQDLQQSERARGKKYWTTCSN